MSNLTFLELEQMSAMAGNCESTSGGCNGSTNCVTSYAEGYDNPTGNYCCCLTLNPTTGKTRN